MTFPSDIKGCMKDFNVDIKKVEPKAVQAEISTAKNELISPDSSLAVNAVVFRLALKKLF